MRMKNFFGTAAGVVLCLVFAASCRQGNRPLMMESFHYEDSTEHVSLSMKVELPADAGQAAKAIRARLQMDMDEYLSRVTSYEGDRLFDPFAGDKGNTQAFVTYYGSSLLAALGKNAKDDADERVAYIQEDPSFTEEDKAEFIAGIPDWEYDFTFSKVEETPGYVVFRSQDYTYLGGAHGGVGGDGWRTFRKKDGSLVEHLVDRTRENDMQPLLIAGLLRYYKEMDVEMTEEELLDNLMIDQRHIPLPVWEPYPTAEGLLFTYHQYEIASYAEGMPSFVVPYDEIDPYLTPEAKQLL